MKKIGMLGGMSWESTSLYYSLINQTIKAELGGLHSARILMSSVDFAEIATLQKAGNWDATADILRAEAQGLERAGADFIVIATNTMHKILPRIENDVSIPFLHIAEATGHAIKAAGFSKVALVGTQFSMEDGFYIEYLTEQFGLEVIVPERTERQFIHHVIFDELCQGIINEDSRAEFVDIMDRLVARGAQGIIEGCTEITMLVKPEHVTMPLFDTTSLHATAAAKLSLQ